jgi:hypothetical protein
MTPSPRMWLALGVGALILALVAALLVTRATLADAKRELATADAKLAVSNQSIDVLEKELRRVMSDQRQLEQGDATRMRASKEALAVADAASKVRLAAIERLQASAEVLRPTPAAECEFSPAVLENWP